MDVTDDPVHGQQKSKPSSMKILQRVLCSLLIFCGYHLLAAKLLVMWTQQGVRGKLQRIVPQIQQRWPKTQIIVCAATVPAAGREHELV